MCRPAGRLDDLRGHLEDARFSFLHRIHDSARDHEFDQVRPAFRDLVNIFYGLFRRCYGISERSRHVPAGHRDSGIACQDPGTRHCRPGRAAAHERSQPFRRRCAHGNPGHTGPGLADHVCQPAAAGSLFRLPGLYSFAVSLFDLIPKLSVIIRNTADSPDRSHAAVQRRVGVSSHQGAHRLPGNRVGSGQIHETHIVLGLLLLSGRLAPRIQMHMQIDQTGHQIAPFKIYDLASRRDQFVRGEDRRDPAVFYNYSFSLLRHHILRAVQYNSTDICCFHRLPFLKNILNR